MAVPITRYRASRQFLWGGLAALALTLLSTWVALRWPYAWIPAGLALLTSILLFSFAFRPIIEIFESHLKIGGRAIPWAQIRSLERICLVPLLVRLTMADRSLKMLVFGGDTDGCNSLLRHLRRYSREALIDGVPYRQFWGEAIAGPPEERLPRPKRYPLLLEADEAEVERLFQRLKAVGHIDPKGSSDEK